MTGLVEGPGTADAGCTKVVAGSEAASVRRRSTGAAAMVATTCCSSEGKGVEISPSGLVVRVVATGTKRGAEVLKGLGR